MEVYEIIEYFIKLRDGQATNDKVCKAGLDISLKQSKLGIVFSLLLKENILMQDDNDEIVLELIINRQDLTGRSEIYDSKGNYYLKDADVNICDEYIAHLAQSVRLAIGDIAGNTQGRPNGSYPISKTT
ncbi:MAG: hypothetical protein Q3966_00970 [Neisseria sp.]|nr:hypothetical protein [Neisseria sp.]